MEKSIQAFSDLSKGCIQRLVLGDMLDLGKSTSDAHRRILNLALVSGFDRIYLFGEEFSKALKNSKNNSHAKTFLKMEDLIEGLKKDLAPDDFVFLKGSRGMRLERVLESLSQ
jgi:UDP-N-acetylmuramoyl-tripeptide--D-alanyl-D-alanine ligase